MLAAATKESISVDYRFHGNDRIVYLIKVGKILKF